MKTLKTRFKELIKENGQDFDNFVSFETFAKIGEKQILKEYKEHCKTDFDTACFMTGS